MDMSPISRGTRRVTVVRRGAGDDHQVDDTVLVEGPLEILVDAVSVATTMRTPGDDDLLALGFSICEGLIPEGCEPVVEVIETAGDGARVLVTTGNLFPQQVGRLGLVSSSCGVCGTADLPGLIASVPEVTPMVAFDSATLIAVAASARSRQELFAVTGGSHAAAAFDSDGRIVAIAEDVGRHNAVDKVLGRLFREGRLPAGDLGLFVSGRASFEMVQKACVGGFAALVSVSAPSSAAVEAAARAGLRLLGFARGDQATEYVADERPS
ncbi:MAG: sulfurtransferase FdhD [Actinobacteria bacterium]|nr:sulfurtransferase FdhD [Actinomycetota bacterium]